MPVRPDYVDQELAESLLRSKAIYMWRIFFGIGLIALGITAFVLGLQYASFAMPTDVDAVMRERYRFYSSLFGYTSYALIIGGIIATVWAIRKRRS